MLNNFKYVFQPNKSSENLNIVISEISELVGSERISTDEIKKLAYGKDYWVISNLMTLNGIQPTLPDLIVWPNTSNEITQILKIASKYQIPVIPYGEGSGVVGGALAIHGGIILDMKYFDEININQMNMTVTAGTGINGAILERYLNERGFRMGHIPQSIRTSTLGGYIAHRAAGQFSGLYGKIEDIVMSMEVVLPNGEIMESKTYPKASVGPMVDRLFLGSEGTLGIVTKATCKIWPMPEKQGKLSFVFADMQSCLNAVKDTVQNRVNPAVVRIYDKTETEKHFGSSVKKAKNKIMLIFVFEGLARLVDLEMQITAENCEKYHGINTGDSPLDHWFKTRFAVTDSSVYCSYGYVMDTIEVSCMWDRANDIYESLISAVKNVPGVMTISGHASHFYTTGVCWYFSFSAIPKKNQPFVELYDLIWDTVMEKTLSLGGSISHHHGVGVNRTRWMQLEHGKEFQLMQDIKTTLDPQNILNPGKLYPSNSQKSQESQITGVENRGTD